jgi:hypothetical protein
MFDFDQPNGVVASANYDSTYKYIYMNRQAGTSFYSLSQAIEGNFNNKTFTISINCNTYGQGLGIVICDRNWNYIATNEITPFNGIACFTFNSLNNDFMRIILYPQANEFVVKNIALYEGEYTAETLPEYQPKGYAHELAECIRYYYCTHPWLPFGYGNVDYNGTDVVITIPISGRMRAIPTVLESHSFNVRIANGTNVYISGKIPEIYLNGNNITAIYKGIFTDTSRACMPVSACADADGFQLFADL